MTKIEELKTELDCALDDGDAKKTEDVFAQILHEAGRKAVMTNKVLKKDSNPPKFIEWDTLPEDAREGRRIQSRFLLQHLNIDPI